MIVKLILNSVLINIESIGINGAVISSIIAHMVSSVICFIALKRTISIKFKLTKFIFKPLIASLNMGICSYYIYNIFIYNFLIQKHISFFLSLITRNINILFINNSIKNFLKRRIFYASLRAKAIQNS